MIFFFLEKFDLSWLGYDHWYLKFNFVLEISEIIDSSYLVV